MHFIGAVISVSTLAIFRKIRSSDIEILYLEGSNIFAGKFCLSDSYRLGKVRSLL